MTTEHRIDLLYLREAAEEILANTSIRSNAGRDPVNWADLHCVRAERAEDERGAIRYRVWIEEASPESPNLRAFVRYELEKRGFKDVEVMTEW